MKTHIYIILSGCISSAVMHAQITLTQSNNAPAPGDVQSTKALDSTATLDKSSGANKTWNYSTSVTNSTNTAISTVSFTSASSIPGASMFTSAGANVAATDSSQFLKSTSTSLETIGSLFSDGGYVYFSNPQKVMQFPFSYSNSFTDSYSGTINLPSASATITMNGNINVMADAYGTIILPSDPSNISFSNVLRVKSYDVMNVSGTLFSIPFTGTVTTTQYLYFKSGTKQPFFTIMYQHSDIPAFGPPTDNYNITYDAALPVSVQEVSNNTPSLFIFPNPSKDVLNIQMNKADYRKIQIIDVQGKVLKNIEIKPADIQNVDISFLPSGNYILYLSESSSGLSDVSYKFIKE